MIKYCVFDLDGTLLNTITTITHYVNRVLRAEGLKEINEEECKIFVGDGAYKLIERALGSRGVFDTDTVLRVLDAYTHEYHRNTLYLTEPYDGVLSLLQGLKERGIATAVLSNKPDVAAVLVTDHFFPGMLSLCRGGIDGVPLKPAPDALLSIMEQLGAKRGEVAFIGDTAVDIATAKNAGVALSVGCLWGFRDRRELEEAGADRLIAHPEELIEVIENEK